MLTRWAWARGTWPSSRPTATLAQLPVKIVPSLAPGLAAIPAGLPGLEGVLPPFHARISRAERGRGVRGAAAEAPDAVVARGPDAGTRRPIGSERRA